MRPAASLHRLANSAVAAALLALLLPFLAHALARVPRATPLDYNEGWNAFHVSRLLEGGPLYPPVDGLPLTPLNYPPLSFLLMGALAKLTGSVVMTGRALSLAALAAVSLLLFRTITALTGSRRAAALGGLLWLGLLARRAPAYVGSFDPQMLGHAFSMAALFLYARWRHDLTRRRVFVLAALCCTALFVKHLLLAAPAAIAIVLALENRRHLPTFALLGIGLSAALAAATRLLGGEHVVPNLFAFGRIVQNARLVDELDGLFVGGGVAALFLPFGALLVRPAKGRPTVVLAYFAAALLVGAWAVRGVGVDRNAWFEFFLAASLTLGVFAGEAERVGAPGRPWLAGAVAASALVPMTAHLGTGLREAFNYAKLDREEEAYRKDVELLRSTPGPALFEEPLLGYDAGKELLFDPFVGSQMIVSGRLPEAVLVDAARRRDFAAIVLTSEVERALARPRTAPPPEGPPRLVGWWTRRTLEAVRDAYALADPGRRRYGYFYFPRKP